MKKLISLMFASLLLTALFAGCTAKETQTLNLYTWEGMFTQDLLDQFTEETGIEINYANFDLNENMLSKLETSNGGEYDLVIADDYIIESVIEKDLALPLDKDKIDTFGNINAFYQGQFYDPEDAYTVPFGAGVVMIAYDPALTGNISSYNDLWSPLLEDSVGVIANYRVVNGIALKIMGASYNTEDLYDLEQAGQMLTAGFAPNIRLIKDDNLQDDLISGEISAAVLYTSQAMMAKKARPELEVALPSEGVGFGVMGGFIPKNAPNADAAHAFLQFILQPEVSKDYIENLGYFNTNAAADDLLSEEFKAFSELFASAMQSDKTEMIENVSADALDAHEEIWTAFRSAAGQ